MLSRLLKLKIKSLCLIVPILVYFIEHYKNINYTLPLKRFCTHISICTDYIYIKFLFKYLNYLNYLTILTQLSIYVNFAGRD